MVQVKKLVIASNNQHKLQEFRELFGDGWLILGARDVSPGIQWVEDGASFLENARKKIEALRPHTEDWILADDSGLCVDILQGAPGVHSSSYGGVEGDHERNVATLLQRLQGIDSSKRQAHFYCLLLLSSPGGREELSFEGRCAGVIAKEPFGKGGFGYDPIFIPEGSQRTLAEFSAEEKNKISHRGRAFHSLKNGFDRAWKF